MNPILDKLYTDPESVAGFAGLEKLYREGKKHDPDLKISDVANYLASQSVYTEYAPRRFKFLKRPVFISKPNHSLTADLADFQNLSTHNEGFKYVLFILDYFSRKLSTYPVRDKKSGTIAACFDAHLKKNPNYKFIHVDEGGEFRGRANDRILRKYGLKQYFVKSRNHKAAVAERAIRTVKDKLYKILDYNNTKSYLAHMQRVVETYNRTPHRGLLNLTPNLVHKLTDPDILGELSHVLYLNKFKNYSPRHLYNTTIHGPSPVPSVPRYKIGDHVKILNSDSAEVFSKGYLPGYTKEIFVIRKIYKGPPLNYRISDLAGDRIDGTFYAQDFKKAILPTDFQIEKILRSKKIGKTKHYLVSYKGWPTKFDEWLPAHRVYSI